jgi:predicted deacylase
MSLMAAGQALAQRGAFTVGSITAKPGQMASGIIEIPAAVDAGTELPITVFHGTQHGPVLALVAGNHGYEYSPILALQRLRSLLDPVKMSGTVIMVQVANMPSFLGRTIYYSPIDNKNLNRAYPGKKDGTASERIAYFITTEVIEKSDYLVDLHCGDGNESLRHYVYLPESGDSRLDQATREMVLAFGIDHIVIDRGRPTDPEASIYCSSTGTTRGKPSFTVESGFLGTRDEEAIQRIVNGVQSLMRHFEMLDGEPERVENPVFLYPTEVLRSPATGILYPHVKRGRTVAEGTLLATITDFFGKTLAEVRAPMAGVVLYIVATPPISTGEPVGMIGAVRP